MVSDTLDSLNNLFIDLLDAEGVEKQTVRPAPNRAFTLRRATPGFVVAVFVWSLVFVLSVGTNGALAAALAQYLSIPPGLVDAVSSLTGERDPEPERDLAALVVPSVVPEIDHFQHSGVPPASILAQLPKRSPDHGGLLGLDVAASILADVPKRSPDQGGLLGVDFMHALANNHPLSVGVGAHPDAWASGGVANRIGTTGPVHAGPIGGARSNGAVSDGRSSDGQARKSQIQATEPHIQATEPQIQATEPQIQATEPQIQATASRIPAPEAQIQAIEPQIQAIASQIPAPESPIVVASYANEPTIDSVPSAKSTPNTGPASTQPADKLVTLGDTLTTLAHQPTSLTDDDVPRNDSVLDPRLGVDFAELAAALAATSVPAPGTMGLLAGAVVAWPIARRMRFGSARRTRFTSSTSPRD